MIVDNYTKGMESPYFYTKASFSGMLRFKFENNEARLCLKLSKLFSLHLVNCSEESTYKSLRRVFK